MIEKEIPCAIIMEDDVEFHQRWHELAPRYWQATPKDFDVLYIGNQMDAPASGNIVIVPVYCTHAYIITLQGAKAFYDLCVKCPTGTRMMDCMINDSMRKSFETNGEHMPFTWYVWNASMFPDSNMYKRPDYWAIRNTGLVFQDAEFGSHVRPF
jgi:GR25 family glycosyltransferase involved in LPS biosynthesis